MQAQTLHCQSCGAAVADDAPTCAHCGARLATIACPACFGMMFLDMKFCPHCGSAAAPWQAGEANLPCPACQVPMLQGTVAQTPLHECGKCFGLWLDAGTFEQLCRDAERQAAVLREVAPGAASGMALEAVRYRRCPVCREMMHRVNFAQSSGVVVDVCRGHGTWFDRSELQRIVQFIRSGGLDLARERRKAELAAEARRLETARSAMACGDAQAPGYGARAELLSLVAGCTSGLLGRWLKG